MKVDSRKILITLSALMFCFMASAQDINPYIGTWDIDKAGSNFGSSLVPANMSRTYSEAGDNSFMFLVVSIGEDGNIGGSSARYKYDSQENPMTALNISQPTTISYRKENDKTVQYTVRVNGEISQIGAKTISPDGRVLTIAVQNVGSGEVNNQILKFNRRR